jgi:hypothetical protein
MPLAEVHEHFSPAPRRRPGSKRDGHGAQKLAWETRIHAHAPMRANGRFWSGGTMRPDQLLNAC